jgi:hypothetical protein
MGRSDVLRKDILMARAIAVLKLTPKIKNTLAFAKNVATALNNNAALPAPTPTLAQFQTDIDALDTAETAVLNRTKGAAETRNVKLAVVRSDLEEIKTYVQHVADTNTTTAESIIEGAGMGIRKVTLRNKAALAAEQGSVSGTVEVVAKAAARRASYEWQYSLDQKTWTQVPSTLQAKTSISGLTPVTAYFFRVRPVIAAGEQDWSAAISLLVT